MKLIDTEAKAPAKARSQPSRLDSDPFIDAQDFDIKSFTVEVQEVGRSGPWPPLRSGTTRRTGTRRSFLSLVKTRDAWRIDDFRGDGRSVRKYLSKSPNAARAPARKCAWRYRLKRDPATANIAPMDAPNPSATPTFASRTPLHIGAIGLVARDLHLLSSYYQQLLGLTVLERTDRIARLGVAGVTLIEIEHQPDAKPDDPRPPASITPRS